jgi:D-arabinose 1-dehydrogenase-like Zn-dependent alcohol dehydrogenase
MRRARLTQIGWDQDLVIENDAAPPPTPTGRQVLLEVEACGVCHRDLIDRSGRFPFQQVPITPGHEAVGRVIAVGDQVKDWKIGDRVGTMHRDACGECAACNAGETTVCERAAFVLGILVDGGYASRLLVPESALFAMPEDLSPAAAAIQHCTWGTAWRGLGAISPGQRVLVTGSNGGVGSAAVPLAVARGAEVIAIVRDPGHADEVKARGAHEVIVDDGTSFHKRVRGIDVALECVGQPTFNSSLRTLRVGGRIVVIGNVVNERVQLNLGYMITSALHMRGSSGATRADMAALFAFMRETPLAMPTTELDLARADEAQRLVRKGGLSGRLVLRP